jgi:hypothetical protein
LVTRAAPEVVCTFSPAVENRLVLTLVQNRYLQSEIEGSALL